MRRSLSHIDAFISPSIFSKTKHHELGLNVPITHIPHFLSTSENNENESFQYGRPYFLFVGRLEKLKGVQNLIAAFRNYKPCDLLVAGDGGYAPTLRKLAVDVTNVKFLGRLPYNTLRAVYRNALAVIVPSIAYEVFGIINIEAFAMRVPVIVNNSGALPEVVRQSGGGLIYNTEDELIAHMEKIRVNPDLRQGLGAKGYSGYLKYWTEENYLASYYQLIREIAAHKNLHNPVINALGEELDQQVPVQFSAF
jgi:glycosyltransferase involved in cell wall biosynthesis